MNPQRSGEGEIGRRVDDPRDDPPLPGRFFAAVELPGDDFVAPPLDLLAQRRRRGPHVHRRRQAFENEVFDRGVVFQRRQDLQSDAGELAAALVQQRGDVVRHVLAGVEKIGHQHDPPHAPRGQLGNAVENVRPRNRKERRQNSLHAQPPGDPLDHRRETAVDFGAGAAVADDDEAGGAGGVVHKVPSQQAKSVR